MAVPHTYFGFYGAASKSIYRPKMDPGLITGVGHDDPSGLVTYSQAGAHFGLNTQWTIPLAFPLMAGVQSMCANLGRVIGKELVANIKTAFSSTVLRSAVVMFAVHIPGSRLPCARPSPTSPRTLASLTHPHVIDPPMKS
jgi:hypothetical protein